MESPFKDLQLAHAMSWALSRKGQDAAWSQFGLPLSTTSNDAAKMYDAILTQFCGAYNDESVGGIDKSMDTMMAADPNFVMGSALVNMLSVLGTSRNSHTSDKIRQSIDEMTTLMTNNDITARERMHVEAVKMFAEGDQPGACGKWKAILLDYPTDMLAIMLAHQTHYYMGDQQQMRDTIARVLPHWNKQMPLYGYVLGNYAFGLVETNLFREAEDTAREALNLNPRDVISTHALLHVLEYEGRQNEAINFLNSTQGMWDKCDLYGSHNHWHWALFHMEKGEYDEALGIFDQEIALRAHNKMQMTDILDATSFLYRYQLEAQNVGDRWQDIIELCRPHLDDHILALNDVHLLMGCIGAGQTDMTNKLMTTLKEHMSKTIKTWSSSVFQEVGLPLCEAFVAADEGGYAKAVDLLYPVRSKVVNIGGSNAERNVFNLFLIDAAMKSPEKRHHKLVRCLLSELQAIKQNSPLTERLMARSLALHVD